MANMVALLDTCESMTETEFFHTIMVKIYKMPVDEKGKIIIKDIYTKCYNANVPFGFNVKIVVQMDKCIDSLENKYVENNYIVLISNGVNFDFKQCFFNNDLIRLLVNPIIDPCLDKWNEFNEGRSKQDKMKTKGWHVAAVLAKNEESIYESKNVKVKLVEE